MFTTRALLTQLTTADPTRPRITHYDEGGRIELSGKVLVNWVNKAMNLLEENYDLQPGEVVAIDLPAGHWRTLYWALAAWGRGAHVVLPDPRTDPQTRPLAREVPLVAITTRPHAWQETGAEVVAVDTAALSRGFPGDVAGALDEAAELATYGDVADPVDPSDAADPALSDRAYSLGYGDLVDGRPGERLLLPVSEESSRMQVLVIQVSVLYADGSVVVTHGSQDTDHLAEVERATVLDV